MSEPVEPESGPDAPPGPADAIALTEAFPVIYQELRRLAHRNLQKEPSGHTLATTDLVHEAYLKLRDQTRVEWKSRAHFMAVAATAMRRILVDHARRRQTAKHGGGLERVRIEAAGIATAERADLVVALDGALDRLRDFDARQAKVVECHFFGGMTMDETADALDIGLRTAKRDWAKAKSWLYREMSRGSAS